MRLGSLILRSKFTRLQVIVMITYCAFVACNGDDRSLSYQGDPCPSPPSCPAELPTKAAPCPYNCEGLTCPYEIETSCGTRTARANCVWYEDDASDGWFFSVDDCPTDCASIADQAACDAELTCIWLIPCPDSPLMGARCATFPLSIGLCESDTCPAGTSCAEMYVDPRLPYVSSCEGAGAVVTVCEPG